MRRAKGVLFLLLSLAGFGVVNVASFSQKLFESSAEVRAVHVIGLTGGAVTVGAALASFFAVLVAARRIRTEDHQSPDQQPAPPCETSSRAP